MSLLTNDNIDDKKEFTRRAFIIGAAQGGLLAVLGGRLGWLQLAQGQRYKMLSDKNRIDVKIIAPLRGEILDRHGKSLAINDQNFRVLITPEQAPSPADALQHLKPILNLTDDAIQKALKNIKRVAKFTSVEIKDQLSWEDISKIEVNINELPGISTDIGNIRTYPLKEATAHLVGYVGAPTQDDLNSDRLFSMPGFKIGKTGLERELENELRGKAGLSQVEVNVAGREVHELDRNKAKRGKTQQLTIDLKLQEYVQNRLREHVSGSVVVMNAHSGEIYAMASHPSFDPNLFVRGMPSKTWKELLENPGHPLTNKTIAGQYPPGSTFKMVTALAALKQGVINERTSFNCPGHYDLNEQRFHCWKHSGHGRVNVKDALTQSCDVFFYKIAAEVGIENIAEMARQLGLGQLYENILPQMRSGLVPDKQWKMGMGQVWHPGDSILTSIGQGSLLATPLQLAVMTARLINGQNKIVPSLLIDKIPAMNEQLNIPNKHLEIIKHGMDMVINDKKGTAYGSRILDPNQAFGGKTGTAQVKRITLAQRRAGIKNEELPWRQRHHALFVGYAPLDKPDYVCSVVIEHGGGGSAVAAPIAKDILQITQDQKLVEKS